MIVDPIIVDHRIRAPGASIDLVVPENLYYLRGHFPGMPVVPGVVQIRWAFSLAQLYLRADLAFRGMEALKFQQVMLPGSRVMLELKYAEAAGKLYFSFSAESARFSSGRMLLRATA